MKMIDLRSITNPELIREFTDPTTKVIEWMPLKTFTPTMDIIVLLTGKHGYCLGKLTSSGWIVNGGIWYQPTFEIVFTHYAYIKGPG